MSPNGKNQWHCRQCQSEKSANYAQRNPQKVATAKLSCKAKKPDYYKSINRIYRINNSEKCAASTLRWRRDNSGRHNLNNQNRRASKVNAVVPDRPVTAAIEEKRKALFNGCCYCGAQKKLTLEHVVALDAGGLHVEENLLGACPSCNSSKNNRPVEQWFRTQKFFTEERWQQIQQALEG